MSIKIAGRHVKIGNKLYHSKLGWGVVDHFDSSGPAVLLVNQKPYGIKKIYVQTGGLVGDEKLVYWHKPLTLDYPSENIDLIQEIVNAIVDKLPKHQDDIK